MQINIRNGIVNAESTLPFINLVGNSINLNAGSTPITITFAYGAHDYVFSEMSSINSAWTITNGQYWLFWDLNLTTGVRTFGSTNINPFSYTNGYGFTLPPNPQINQMFFDYNTKTMKFWNGSRWIVCLRVFAASVNGNILTPFTINQTQVGLNSVKNAGYIIFDNNSGKPVTSIDNNGLSFFVTTEHLINTQINPYNSYKIDALLEQSQALQAIPKYSCVSLVGPNQIGLSSYLNYQNPCIGIAVDNFGSGDIKNIVTHGYIIDNVFFNFGDVSGVPLFVGPNGELTTSIPSMYSIQQVGYVVSNSTVYIDIKNLIVIEDNIITPTPSITPSVTPTISISLTRSPTVTPTLTQTRTLTTTPTITPTNSLTPSITPTITPSQTTTITPTMTLTRSITASPTPSITPTFTPTITPTDTVTPTPSVTLTPSNTATVTPTATASVTPSNTATVTPSTTATISLTPTSSVTPSNTATVTPTNTVTPSNTATVTPTNTVTPSNTATVTPSTTATISLTPTSSVTPSNTATVTPTNTVTPSITPSVS